MVFGEAVLAGIVMIAFIATPSRAESVTKALKRREVSLIRAFLADPDGIMKRFDFELSQSKLPHAVGCPPGRVTREQSVPTLRVNAVGTLYYGSTLRKYGSTYGSPLGQFTSPLKLTV